MRCQWLLRGDSDGYRRVSESIEAAQASGRGDFSAIDPCEVPVGQDAKPGGEAARRHLEHVAEHALNNGVDWLFVIDAMESVASNIFVTTAPALRVHDAVWGGAGLTATGKLERITRLAAQDLPGFFHAALAWWIGPSHFVRPAEARRALEGVGDGPDWYADYLVNLWTGCSAYKTAQCLTLFDRAVPPVADAVRDRLIAHLARRPVFMEVRCGGRRLKLPYTGLNPVIEREQMRGLFFEQDELQFLADRLPRGMRIIDAGANTGNHTLFFAAAMEAESVIPIEPHPRAMAAIRAMVAENSLENVDLSLLGYAIGAGEGRLAPVDSVTAGLGATHYKADARGDIRLARLDDLAKGPVDFIKIDVEGMEMDVLAGAAGLIARHPPILFIEVVDTGIGKFLSWLDKTNYRIEKLFPDKTHCNYLVSPAERPGGRARS